MKIRAWSLLIFVCSYSLSLFASQEAVDHTQQAIVDMADKNDLLQSVMQGRFEFFSANGAYSPLPGAAFKKNDDGSFYYSSGMNYAPCNGVIGNDEKELSEKEIKHAIQFFESRKIPFIWWTSSKKLEKKGFQFGGILTGIVLDISRYNLTSQPSSRVQIREVRSDKDLWAFTRVAVTSFGMDANTIEQFYAVNAALMNRGELIHYLALIDGVPVGTVTLSTTKSSAGIWNLGTLPESRKAGVGTALVSAALLEAKKRHYNHVMAILMPKGMAWGIFTNFGFQEVCQFPFYVFGASAEELEK